MNVNWTLIMRVPKLTLITGQVPVQQIGMAASGRLAALPLGGQMEVQTLGDLDGPGFDPGDLREAAREGLAEVLSVPGLQGMDGGEQRDLPGASVVCQRHLDFQFARRGRVLGVEFGGEAVPQVFGGAVVEATAGHAR